MRLTNRRSGASGNSMLDEGSLATALGRGRRHRVVLVEQLAKLLALGVRHGVICVQVAHIVDINSRRGIGRTDSSHDRLVASR